MNLSPKISATLRWLLLILAGTATLLAAFIEIENWRGDRAWAAAEKELKAKGELFDPAALQPQPIPQGQNLFGAPKIALIVTDQPGSPERKKLLAETRLMDFDLPTLDVYPRDNFASLRDNLKKAGLLAGSVSPDPAADVLIAYKPLQPLFDELREAARLRPKAILVRGSNDFNLRAAFLLGNAIAVRAMVEIELGRIDDAYADIFALQRFANGLMEQPVNLLALLIGAAIQENTVTVISYGCQRHVWSEPRLAQFQKALSELHPLANFRKTVLLEGTHCTRLLDAPPRSKWLPWWLFHGWAQQNKARVYRHLENDILSTFTAGPDRIFPERHVFPKKTTGTLAIFYSPYEWLSRMTMSNMARILGHFGTDIDKLELNSVSWAIERYQLAHSRYPETLDELVPAFLDEVPNGIFDGQPFRYTKLPKGGHQIYCTGQNGRNEGGTGHDIVLKLPDVPSTASPTSK